MVDSFELQKIIKILEISLHKFTQIMSWSELVKLNYLSISLGILAVTANSDLVSISR